MLSKVTRYCTYPYAPLLMSFTTLKSSLEGCDDCSEVDDVFSKLTVEVRLSLVCSDGSVDWGGPERERERSIS